MPIRNVSDTAFWVAMYRAFESERPDAIFHDAYARLLAGERGAAIVNELPQGQALAWSMIVRTAVIDEMVQDCIERGARTVLNLGAGLDTRAYRLALPADLNWFDVDLPAIIKYRADCLRREKPVCRHQPVAADLSDAAVRSELFAQAREAGGPLLVLTEGLLVYLEPEQVRELATQIHTELLAHWWLTDLIAPILVNTIGALWQQQLRAADSCWRFAPADGSKFFAASGWREIGTRSLWDESVRLNRSAPMAWFWNAFSQVSFPGTNQSLQRMATVALLERNPVWVEETADLATAALRTEPKPVKKVKRL
jgi:methyltransferase (TIGR00027 family)